MKPSSVPATFESRAAPRLGRMLRASAIARRRTEEE
jgi:hypothetical protein